jgi:DNA-binding transcriptional MerR regulator
VTVPAQHIGPTEAAERLGVSVKALRIYEQRGLLAPVRTATGWRTYGPDEMARAVEIAGLRRLGFSLVEIARVLNGDAQALEPALAVHQETLEGEIRKLTDMADKVQGLRRDLARGRKPAATALVGALTPKTEPAVAFDLPWPWGGERFELREIRRLNYIVGPLGSGKTRLAQCLAKAVPNAIFLPMERVQEQSSGTSGLSVEHKARVGRGIAWIVDDGGHESDALVMLIAALEAKEPEAFVIDMIEQGLDQDTQEALIAYLRHGRRDARPLFFLTRSNAILNLGSVGADEAIILCPANHSPPSLVVPTPGAAGYEVVSTCLASPEVRKRTEGVIAWRP